MVKRLLIFIMLTFVSNVSYSLQMKPVKNNQSVSAKIASNELSRIFVSGDRIKTTRGISGAYEVIKDEKQGMIFIKPSNYYVNRPFNLFLTTEQGRTFSLLLTPKNIPAVTIELKPLTPSIKMISRWEKNSPYVETIIRLMNDMVNENHPDGYAVIPVEGKIYRFPSFTMQLTTVLRGDKLQGEIWRIKNCLKRSIDIKPNEFFQRHTRATALQSETLLSGGETYLYKVINHG